MEKLLQVAGAIIIIVVLFMFKQSVDESRSELKQEKACIEDAKSGQDMQKCFDLMDSHKKP